MIQTLFLAILECTWISIRSSDLIVTVKTFHLLISPKYLFHKLNLKCCDFFRFGRSARLRILNWCSKNKINDLRCFISLPMLLYSHKPTLLKKNKTFELSASMFPIKWCGSANDKPNDVRSSRCNWLRQTSYYWLARTSHAIISLTWSLNFV